jgi:hypothetical protein
LANKKALSTATIYIIIVIIGFFAVLAFFNTAFAGLQESQAEKLCQETVAARFSFAIRGGDITELKAFPILCKTIDKKVKGDKPAVEKQIADLMGRCWDMFGQGRYGGLFQTTGLSPIYSHDCFVCYTATVQGLNEKISQFEFKQYLRENKYKNATYIDYIQSSGGPGSADPITDIANNGVYAIAFASKNSDKSVANKLLSTFNDLREVSVVYVADLTKLQEVCTIQSGTSGQ